MNEFILNSKVQQFIHHHLNDDPTKMVLNGSPFQEINIKEIVAQIISKKKCEKKLPTWFRDDIYFPNKLNIEQSSSEQTAKYKSTLLFGDSIIDITGGFGVDCYYFSKKFSDVIHCEINENLSHIVNHNFNKLQVSNVEFIAQNGLDHLIKSGQHFDWIYADPSRRSDVKGRVFLLKDCLPNIPEHLNLLFQFSDNIMLKISPLMDIQSARKELMFVNSIYIVAVDNEVKELLFILKKGYLDKIKILTINIKKNGAESFESILNSHSIASFSLPKSYIYEPNKAILKAGLFHEISREFHVDKLHKNSHLYTSHSLVNFPGRRFRLIQAIRFDKKILRKFIPSKKANITVRNFPQTVAQIRKKTGIKEGGNSYLLFTTDLNNKPIVLICEKITE